MLQAVQTDSPPWRATVRAGEGTVRVYKYGDHNLTYLTSWDRLYSPRWGATVRLCESQPRSAPQDYRQGSKLYVPDVMLQAVRVQPTLGCDREASCEQKGGASTSTVLYERTTARTYRKMN